VRFYAEATGSVLVIEALAERGRVLLHRQKLTIGGYQWIISSCDGPIVADESGAYGRIISLSLMAQEE
jgi:hypothetical protein